jgi:ABC-type oligopeptide transport system substrate-binding subunit
MKAVFLRYVLPLFVVVAAITLVAYIYHLPRVAIGDKQYGGILKISSKSDNITLFPLADNTLEHHRVQQLIFEPLLKPSKTARGWSYCLANKITFDSTRQKLLIHLRKNVHFSDNACFRFRSSELSAEDVAFSLSLACSQQAKIKQDLILPELILGGLEFYKAKLDPLKRKVNGIRIIDNYTIEVTLNGAYNHFLNVLSSPSLGILSKQAATYYGAKISANPVGTGPFKLEKREGKEITFERNHNYWHYDSFGNQLPYIDQVKLTCGIQGQSAHRLFLKNQLDLLFDLPIDDLSGAFGTLSDAKSGKNPLHDVYIKSAAKVHFIQFNCTSPPFDQLGVRRAFALAIDANTICNEVLMGEGRQLNKQFIPTTSWNKNSLVKPDKRSMAARILEAKSLLIKEGYTDMRAFPPITFYVGSKKHTLAYKWSKAVAQMLEKQLSVKVLLMEQLAPLNMTAASMWRAGWVGDYPGSESYLRLFYSRAQNPLYFKNGLVDSLYLASVFAQNLNHSNSAQKRCERAIIDLQALIPIYTEDFIVLQQLRVRDFKLDDSGLLDYANLYIKELN